MKVLIVSDTHRQNENFMQVMDREEPIDLLIHCGDIEGSEYLISRRAGCPVHMVAGNNDFFSDLPREEIIDLAGKKILVTHGHTYGVSGGTDGIVEAARARGCEAVLFGHTHYPEIEMQEGILVINPGSLTFPRQRGRKFSYAVMEAEEGKDLQAEIRYL